MGSSTKTLSFYKPAQGDLAADANGFEAEAPPGTVKVGRQDRMDTWGGPARGMDAWAIRVA